MLKAASDTSGMWLATVMSKLKFTPAEEGWYVVTVWRRQLKLSIHEIEPITHWRSDGHPMRDGKALLFDPDDIAHVSFVTFIMDPQGRLVGRDGEVIANSVMALQERYDTWLAAQRVAT